jgi:hypothetical protein
MCISSVNLSLFVSRAGYGLSRLRVGGGITNRAVKANGLVGLCPLLQRCYAGTFLRHLQLLPVLPVPSVAEGLRGDAGAAQRTTDIVVVEPAPQPDRPSRSRILQPNFGTGQPLGVPR